MAAPPPRNRPRVALISERYSALRPARTTHLDPAIYADRRQGMPPHLRADATRRVMLPLETLLVQSIVTSLGPAAEGSLIETVRPVWSGLRRLLASNPNALHQLSPRQLEELVAASYDEAGFDEVILTPRSGDLGRDVIAVKRGLWTVRIIDQVKHFSPDRLVAADDVRALLGVLHGDERATKGLVTTSSSFAPGIGTDPFIAKFVPYRLELIDREALLDRVFTLPDAPATEA